MGRNPPFHSRPTDHGVKHAAATLEAVARGRHGVDLVPHVTRERLLLPPCDGCKERFQDLDASGQPGLGEGERHVKGPVPRAVAGRPGRQAFDQAQAVQVRV